MKFNNTIEEQETTINIFPKSFQQDAEIYTSMPEIADYVLKLAKKWSEEIKITKLDQYSLSATFPREWFRIQKPKKMNFSEEQKQAMRKRLDAVRRRKHNPEKEDDQNDPNEETAEI